MEESARQHQTCQTADPVSTPLEAAPCGSMRLGETPAFRSAPSRRRHDAPGFSIGGFRLARDLRFFRPGPARV
jgi:hypothetical protein